MAQYQPMQNDLLSNLSPTEMALLRPHLREIPLTTGAILHEAQAPIEHVDFPLSGLVTLLTLDGSGHGAATAVIGNEGLVGGSAALGTPYAHNRAQVHVPGTALQVSLPAFISALSACSTLRGMIDRFHATLLSQSQQLVACNALHDVQSRMCRLLLQVRDRTGNNILPLTQDFLAQMLGVQRTTVTAVDRKLQMSGWVRQRRARIELLNIAALTSAACDCYPVTQKYFSQVFPRPEPAKEPLIAVAI